MLQAGDSVRVVGYPHKEVKDEMRAERVYSSDSVFHTKMILLAVGGLNAGFLHRYIFSSASEWRHGNTPRIAKAVAVCYILVWVVVITCGRLLAY